MKIIGLAGTNGSGKDTVGQILADEHNYKFISLTDMLRDELIKQGKPPKRELMRELSASWRRESGLGILIDKAIKTFDTDKANYIGLVVASLRNPGEADRVHELDGQVIWVDADPQVRYERIQKNLANRGEHRSIDDRKTFEQFLSEETAEMNTSGDYATLNMLAVKGKSDLLIDNDGVVELLKTNLKKIIDNN